MSLISLEKVSFRYGTTDDNLALDNVSLAIEKVSGLQLLVQTDQENPP